MGRMGAAVLGAALLLAACESAGPPPGDQGQPAEPEGAQEETAPMATCEDEAGDATARVSAADLSGESEPYEGEIPPHADLRRVDLSISDDTVTARFETEGPFPTDDGSPLPLASANVGVLVDGRVLYALSITETGEGTATEFTQEGGLGSSGTGTVEMEGNGATLSVPVSEVPRMDGEFHWFAFVAAREDKALEEEQARASDTCPNLTEEEILRINSLDGGPSAEVLEKLPTQP